MTVISHHPQRLALLVPDQFAKRHARLVARVHSLHGTLSSALLSLGHDVVDVMRPRDPVVRVRETGSHSEVCRAARAPHRRPPPGRILCRAELSHHRSVPAQLLKIVVESRVLSAHPTKRRLEAMTPATGSVTASGPRIPPRRRMRSPRDIRGMTVSPSVSRSGSAAGQTLFPGDVLDGL